MELALEGERQCKAGDCRTGVQFFEAAVQSGTDDLKTLSAIYSQLGNAYFYLQEYGKASFRVPQARFVSGTVSLELLLMQIHDGIL